MSDDLEYGKYCAKCGQLMDCPPDLEPTPECNPCAQELLASLRSQLQQRDAELEVLRLELKAAEDGSGITNVHQQHEAQLAELHSQAIEWTHQRMEIVAQLAERDETIREMRKQSDGLGLALSDEIAAKNEAVRQADEADGRLLAMRELANPWVMYRGWCNVCCNRILGKHEDGCSWAYTSSLAADARRRVEQQALREAANSDALGVLGKGLGAAVKAWLNSRADSLARPVAEPK